MLKFTEMTAQQLMQYGTNATCLKNRYIVCNAKTQFTVYQNKENQFVVEPGDKFIVSYAECYVGNSKKSVFRIFTSDYVKTFASRTFICSGELEDGLLYDISMDEFKEKFEVVSTETEKLEACTRYAAEQHKKLKEIKKTAYDASCDYDVSTGECDIAIGFIMVLLMTAANIVAIACNIWKALSAHPMGLTLTVILDIVLIVISLSFLVRAMNSPSIPARLLMKRKYDAKIATEQAREQFIAESVNELDAIRTQAGWLIMKS